MILFACGPDNAGKSTQITKIQPYLLDKPAHFLHYSAIKGFQSKEDVKKYSENLYNNMFALFESSYKTNHFVCDRAHIGEYVYSPMYRQYDGSYIFDIEKRFQRKNESFWDEVYLITFIDEAENLIKRDDGLSFTIQLDKKKAEIAAFVKATEESNITHKLILNINGKDADQVHKEVRSFLGR